MVNSSVRIVNFDNKKFNNYYGTVIKILKNGKYKVKIHPYRRNYKTFYMKIKLENLKPTLSYMRWCTNGGELVHKYANTSYDKAVCIHCGWNCNNIADNFNGNLVRLTLDIIDHSTLICPVCSIDSLIIGNHSLKKYREWHNEGFNTKDNPFNKIKNMNEIHKLNHF